MTAKVYDTCALLGRVIAPPPHAADLLRDDRWSEQEREALYRCIREEKIIPQVYRNAQLLRESRPSRTLDGIVEQFEADVERFADFGARIVPAVQREVSAILDEAGVSYLFIKGASFSAYPNGYLRQMNDLDVIVESWDDLFAAAGALSAAGYRHGLADETAWIAHTFAEGQPDERLVGHLNMTRELDGYEIDIDLHTRTYVVASVGALDARLWRRARATGSRIPTPEDALLILIAHAVNHGYFLLKDLNDVYALVSQRGARFDWAYVYICLRRSSLGYAAAYLLERLSAGYPADAIPSWIYPRLRAESRPVLRTLIGLTTRSIGGWREHGEMLIQALHTLLCETACYGFESGLRQSGLYLWWSLRLAVLQKGLVGALGDHALAQRLLHRPRPLLVPFPRRGQPILILPLGQLLDAPDHPIAGLAPTALRESLRAAAPGLLARHGLDVRPAGRHAIFVRRGSAETLVTPIDVFVPTEDAIFTGEEEAALDGLIAALLAIHATPSSALALS